MLTNIVVAGSFNACFLALHGNVDAAEDCLDTMIDGLKRNETDICFVMSMFYGCPALSLFLGGGPVQQTLRLPHVSYQVTPCCHVDRVETGPNVFRTRITTCCCSPSQARRRAHGGDGLAPRSAVVHVGDVGGLDE